MPDNTSLIDQLGIEPDLYSCGARWLRFLLGSMLAMLLALVGAGIAYPLFNGVTVSSLNFASFIQVVFNFTVTAELLLQAIITALAIWLVLVCH